MLVLGIETTCDETAAAVVSNGKDILSNIIFSQIDLHKPFGGVFPEIASRSHIDNIMPIVKKALETAQCGLEEIDLIAVAIGPGLIGSLIVGNNVAKSLALALEKPFVGINHIEAHLYASMMNNLDDIALPALGVVISGGHTLLLKINSIGSYEVIGSTIDDALGECFDKVANILSLPYPGGPEIEKKAALGSAAYAFKPCKTKNRFDFSFSGMKTKILYLVKGQNALLTENSLSSCDIANIAASFQNCLFNDLIGKTLLAAKEANAKAIYFGGGVSNNQTLRRMFLQKNSTALPLFWPSAGLSLDNAAMIAGLGYQKYLSGQKDDLTLQEKVRISFLSPPC